MDLRHIEAIIFDAEGVVVNTEKLWDESQELLLAKRGLAYDRDYLKPRMAGQTLLEGAELMVQYYELNENPTDIALERKVIIDELFDGPIPYIMGFEPFIQWISSINLKKSVATAMNKHLMVKVESQLNLRKYFEEHIYFIEDVGNRSKPEPDVFLHAAEKLGVTPERCLVIEDAPHGIEAAHRAGMTAIGIETTFTKEHLKHADFTGKDFTEIKLFLNSSGINI
jgi:beta-phosphoglucomutase-like phosphatase (HAD superfamily)